MEGEREYSSPPFWPQPQRRPSPSSSYGLGPWVLVLLSSIFIILFFPSFLSSSFRGLRPGSLVKNGWDTLNLCLVLFAILCGLLARNNGDEAEKSPRSSEWPALGYSAPPPVQNSYGEAAVNPTAGIRRMRSSSSYPDLRQEALNSWGGTAEGWRFSDDIQLYHRGRRSEVETKSIPLGSGEGWGFFDDVQMYHRDRRSENNHRAWPSTPEAESKTIPVDTFALRKTPPRSRSPPLTPPPPPPPPPPHRHSRKSSVHNKLPEKELKQETKMEEEKPQPPSPAPPPPPPPPPPPLATRKEKRSPKRKSGGGAKDIATAIALFYHKKRKKGSKTYKFRDDTSPLANAPASPQAARPPPPPPPPPPPSSLFYQLFSHKKGGSKSRRIHSTRAPPPPPPPPPAPLKRRSKKHSSSPPPPPTPKSRNQVSCSPPPPPPPPPPRPPPVPPEVNLYKKRTSLSRFSLPLSSSLPRPPPPPPSPPPTDPQLLFSEEEIMVDGILGGGGGGMEGEKREGKEGVAVFCPSPDVNDKADLFIARFRAGLKLEKLNSLREKQRRQQEEQQQEEDFMMVGGILDDDIIPS